MIYQDWDLELTGPHIRINAMTEDDGEAYGRLLFGKSYEKFIKLLGENDLPTGLKEILARTAQDETHAIRLMEDNRLIGWITLQRNKDGDPDIGISLAESCQNQGFGPEAIMLFCNHLHEAYGMAQVYARISAKNFQSRNAFVKVGAVLDQEITDERFTKLLEENPDHKMAEGFLPKVCCYHIPLPIKEILPGGHPEKEAMKLAQEAYEEEEAQLIREISLIELETIEKRFSSKQTESAELQQYIIERRTELQNNSEKTGGQNT